MYGNRNGNRRITMKKKIVILWIFGMLTSILTACEGDSPAEMYGVYKKHLEETGDMLDALGKYSTDYGWNYFMPEESLRDVSWEEAAKWDNPLKELPKLEETIDFFAYYKRDFGTLYFKSSDYDQTMQDFHEKLDDAGFSFVDKRDSKSEYSRKYGKKADNGKIFYIRITAYEQKYELSHNVQVYMFYQDQ